MMVYVYEYFTKFVAGVMSCHVGPCRIGVSIPSPNFQSSVVVTFPSPGKFQNLSMSVTRVALVSERVDA
jgi:hypothetical protein